MLTRVAARVDNPFGKTVEERAKIVADTREFLPVLRAAATHELDATAPLPWLADELERILEECSSTMTG